MISLEKWQIVMSLIVLLVCIFLSMGSYHFFKAKQFVYLLASLLSAIVLSMVTISKVFIPEVTWFSNISWVLAFPIFPITFGILFAIAEGGEI